MKTRRQLAVFAMGIGLMFSAHATEYDFSAGYVDGPLNGQNGWVGQTNYIVSGELELNPTNWWVASAHGTELSATNNQFTVSAVLTFEEVSTIGGGECMRIFINDAPDGGSSIGASLSRVGGADNYGLAVKSDTDSTLYWFAFPADSLGFDDDNFSDEIIFSLTVFRGDALDNWGYVTTISNATDGVLCASSAQSGMTVTADTLNATALYGGITSANPADGVGITDRLIKSMAISAQYIEPPNFDLVLDIDFQDHALTMWYSQYEADALNSWNWAHCVTNPTAANTNNRYIEHRPGYSRPDGVGTIDGGWKGQLFTTPYRAVEVGETLEFSFDYTQYSAIAGGQVGSLRQLDVFFTTNGYSGENVVPSSEQFFGQDSDANKHLGFMFRMETDVAGGTSPDGIFSVYMDPSSLNPVSVDPAYKTGFIALNEIGLSDVAAPEGDHDGDLLRVIYTAKKTTTTNVWDCTVSISNTVSGSTWIIQESSYLNATAYNATDLYLGMYTYSETIGGEGWEMDNLISKINYAPAPEGWYGFVSDYELSGTKTDDEDLDGLNDWGEYVFGGNPTDNTNLGTQPVFDASSGDYIFALVGDASVVARVGTKGNLVSDSVWTIIDTVNVTETDGALHNYTTPVGTSANQEFIKLLVD